MNLGDSNILDEDVRHRQLLDETINQTLTQKYDDLNCTGMLSESIQLSAKTYAQRQFVNENGKKLPKVNIDLLDDASDDDIIHESINSFYDDQMDYNINAIVQDDVEAWARRYAELYRLTAAKELTELHQQVD